MDFGALYDFLFNTYAGIGCLVGIGLVVSLIACVIMEHRTRKTFVNHEPDEERLRVRAERRPDDEDRLLKSSLHVRAITAFESRRAQLFSCALLFSSRQFSRTLKPYN